MTENQQDVIESLRQQLAAMEDKYLVEMGMRRLNSGEAESLRQQLAAALAAIKVKDAAIKQALGFTGSSCIDRELNKALAIQPDDAALKVWLGEPVAEFAGMRLIPEDTNEFWGLAIDDELVSGTKLYAPKGLK